MEKTHKDQFNDRQKELNSPKMKTKKMHLASFSTSSINYNGSSDLCDVDLGSKVINETPGDTDLNVNIKINNQHVGELVEGEMDINDQEEGERNHDIGDVYNGTDDDDSEKLYNFEAKETTGQTHIDRKNSSNNNKTIDSQHGRDGNDQTFVGGAAVTPSTEKKKKKQI